MISASNILLKYPSGKGIFDISFEAKEGMVTAYLGPNGAGKTTTIRVLMGFMEASKGNCTIQGLDCYREAHKIKKSLGYIPGEIMFPSGMSCEEYLRYQCELRGMKDTSRMKSLIERFELDTKGSIKRFSKGMKQKVGIISAFMHDPKVLILDEPTSGLDPLMQNEFISLILEEKKKGKTILMSSHIFEEVERTCDDVLIIKEGRLVAQSDVKTLKTSKRKVYVLQTPEGNKLQAMGYELHMLGENSYEVSIKGEEVDAFIKKIGDITVTGLDVKSNSLEDVFLQFYGADSTTDRKEASL